MLYLAPRHRILCAVSTTIRLPWDLHLDRLAIGLSGLCLVHCLATSVLLALVSAAGGVLVNPMIHEIGLSMAIVLGAVALGRGVMAHGYMTPAVVGSFGLGMMAGALALPHEAAGGLLGGGEAFWTVIGVGVLAFGHDLNYRAAH